ncbi:MAG TPA: trypsin-like peptidase domain-containing protein [Actinomycetota bacterium]|nr:trypsin-like peptidase domain-containing protein [Actinomycetota bacterium]
MAVVLMSAPGAGAQTGETTGTPEEKAAAVVRPAVVYLEQYWKAWVRVPRSSQLNFQGYVNRGQPFEWATRCSGFVVNPSGYVVTAGHCVDPGEEGARGTALELAVDWLVRDGWIFRADFGFWLDEAHLAWGVEGSEKGSPPDLEVWVQRGVAAGGLRTGEAFPARVIDYQSWSEGDAALLKIEESDLPAVLVGSAGEIDTGLPVLSVGYPGSSDEVTDQSYEPTFKDGQVNSEKTREGGLLPVYEISAAVSGGMSGGPTVNLEGEVVGINSFGIVGETEAFNFITPASLVTEMMARNGAENVLGPIDEAYRAGIDAFFAGDYRAAIERFDEVLGLSPTHQQAQEFRVEAVKLAADQPSPATGEEREAEVGFPVWILAIVAGVAVLAGGGFLLVRRGRPVASAPAPYSTAPEIPTAVPMPGPAIDVPGNGGGRAAPAAPSSAGSAEVASAPEASRVATASAPRFCSNCGTVVAAGTRYCANCGTQLG